MKWHYRQRHTQSGLLKVRNLNPNLLLSWLRLYWCQHRHKLHSGVPRLNIQGMTPEKVTELLAKIQEVEENTDKLTLLVEEDVINEVKVFLEKLLS